MESLESLEKKIQEQKQSKFANKFGYDQKIEQTLNEIIVPNKELKEIFGDNLELES